MSTTNKTNILLNRVRIVLVNTSHPGNIGGAARAMKNMGLQQLYLVQPKHFPDGRAESRAAGAADVLEQAIVVETLEDAIAGCGLVIGTSARGRRLPWPLLNPRDAAVQARQLLAQNQVAWVFGREDRGLSNDELQRCNLHVHIPTSEVYSSLNVAMAVQIIAYELRMAHVTHELTADSMEQWDMPLATTDDLERYFTHLEQTLLAIGFLKPGAPKQLMPRLRRLYARARLDKMEVNLLRGILTAIHNIQHQNKLD